MKHILTNLYSNLKINYYRTGLIFFGATLLCYMAFLNRYPIVDIDSMGYIMSGFHNYVDLFRPSFYGLFIRHISLATSPWIVIYVQALIISFLIFKMLRMTVKKEMLETFFIATIILLVIFTNVSYYVSELMPDIFTPILILSIVLLYFDVDASIMEQFLFCVFIFLSILFHNSNILIAAIVIPLSLLFSLLLKKKISHENVRRYRKKSLLSLCLLLGALIVIINRNNFIEQHPKRAYNIPIFLIDRLDELGVLKVYLEDKCPKEHYMLCAYKDSTKYNFLWDTKNSPLYKNGGWQSDSNYFEFWHIIKDVSTTPKYIMPIVYKSIIKTGIAFFSFGRDNTLPQIKTDISCYWAIKDCFPQDLNEYNTSLQNSGKLDNNEDNNRQFIVVFFTFIFIAIYSLIFSKEFNKSKKILCFITACIITNAMVCGVFSMVTLRYQDRVIWLFPLTAIMLICGNPIIQERINKMAIKNKN